YLANLSLRRGDYAAAAALFERAIASGATDMQLFVHYWGALLRAGASDAALRDKLLAFDRRFPEPPVFRYLLARLLAHSTEVGDVARSLVIARQLYDAQPSPPHAELLALSLAANDDFAAAQALQEGLVKMALMAGALGPAVGQEQTAASLRAGRLPEPPWPLGDPMFMPPPADPELVMHNYPAGQPY
ncbi:MAG: hypothetical protein WBP89_22205, partial [Sedimenticolaceae bacterium]